MIPTATYKDNKGEIVKLSCAGRINDSQIPKGIKQISNVHLYYNQQKFPEIRIFIQPRHN